ncbi:hypothetical protein GCM10023335_01140 [Streptomyces siamensis]|uniref:Uncharacterized protein n=1 Tax=Streptomyces siamensis TaxID=1274986 RepID=A0ABP9IAM5_9ACTN
MGSRGTPVRLRAGRVPRTGIRARATRAPGGWIWSRHEWAPGVEVRLRPEAGAKALDSGGTGAL